MGQPEWIAEFRSLLRSDADPARLRRSLRELQKRGAQVEAVSLELHMSLRGSAGEIWAPPLRPAHSNAPAPQPTRHPLRTKRP